MSHVMHTLNALSKPPVLVIEEDQDVMHSSHAEASAPTYSVYVLVTLVHPDESEQAVKVGLDRKVSVQESLATKGIPGLMKHAAAWAKGKGYEEPVWAPDPGGTDRLVGKLRAAPTGNTRSPSQMEEAGG